MIYIGNVWYMIYMVDDIHGYTVWYGALYTCKIVLKVTMRLNA